MIAIVAEQRCTPVAAFLDNEKHCRGRGISVSLWQMFLLLSLSLSPPLSPPPPLPTVPMLRSCGEPTHGPSTKRGIFAFTSSSSATSDSVVRLPIRILAFVQTHVTRANALLYIDQKPRIVRTYAVFEAAKQIGSTSNDAGLRSVQQSNFLFTEPRARSGRTGPEVARGLYDFLFARKTLVRDFGKPRLDLLLSPHQRRHRRGNGDFAGAF